MTSKCLYSFKEIAFSFQLFEVLKKRIVLYIIFPFNLSNIDCNFPILREVEAKKHNIVARSYYFLSSTLLLYKFGHIVHKVC